MGEMGAVNLLDNNAIIPFLYSHSYTETSAISLTAAASTILRITNFLMALSLGVHLAQFVHLQCHKMVKIRYKTEEITPQIHSLPT